MGELCFDRTNVYIEFLSAEHHEDAIMLMPALYAEYDGERVDIFDEELVDSLEDSLTFEDCEDISDTLSEGKTYSQLVGTALVILDDGTGEYRPLTIEEERNAKDVLTSLLDEKAEKIGKKYASTKFGEYISMDEWKRESSSYRRAMNSLQELFPYEGFDQQRIFLSGIDDTRTAESVIPRIEELERMLDLAKTQTRLKRNLTIKKAEKERRQISRELKGKMFQEMLDNRIRRKIKEVKGLISSKAREAQAQALL